MQTILGSGGAIGTPLAKALTKYTKDIRLVSRNPKKVNHADHLFKADLTQPNDLESSIMGSEVVYVTVGFPYSAALWREYWPEFIRNVVRLCERENCKLVFFDNIYMYDPKTIGHMTEKAEINPISEKGKVRKEIADYILERIKGGHLKGLIARSADFYGPGVGNNSVLVETVFKPLSKGKTANWLVDGSVPHSFSYTPDAAIATAFLGNTESAYGKVWHLPTSHEKWTGKEWVKEIAQALKQKEKMRVVPLWMIKFMGLFNPIMKESVEMMYQNDRPYFFDSSEIEKVYSLLPTDYKKGIRQVVEADFK